MKKFAILGCAILSSVSAFAYSDYYCYSSHSDELSGFDIFILIVMILYIILSIIILIRWFRMTSDVEKIRRQITHENLKLTYLIAIGEKEQANKAALKMLVDLLYPIYYDDLNHSKAESMNKALGNLIQRMQKLGLSVPDYVTSGEKFIDYLNELTGNNVPYQATSWGGTN